MISDLNIRNTDDMINDFNIHNVLIALCSPLLTYPLAARGSSIHQKLEEIALHPSENREGGRSPSIAAAVWRCTSASSVCSRGARLLGENSNRAEADPYHSWMQTWLCRGYRRDLNCYN